MLTSENLDYLEVSERIRDVLACLDSADLGCCGVNSCEEYPFESQLWRALHWS